MSTLLAYILGGIIGAAGQPDASKMLRVYVDPVTASQSTELHLRMSAIRVGPKDGHLLVEVDSMCAAGKGYDFDIRWPAGKFEAVDVKWPLSPDAACHSWTVVIKNTTITSGFLPMVHGPRVTAE